MRYGSSLHEVTNPDVTSTGESPIRACARDDEPGNSRCVALTYSPHPVLVGPCLEPVYGVVFRSIVYNDDMFGWWISGVEILNAPHRLVSIVPIDDDDAK
jgi:hypothetical protein